MRRIEIDKGRTEVRPYVWTNFAMLKAIVLVGDSAALMLSPLQHDRNCG